MSSRYDVLVVGARCAGASTAMLLARAGLKVLAVDAAPAGRDTVSTHALMRGAVWQLHRWGVLDAIHGAGTPLIRKTTFHYDAEAVEIAIKPRGGIAGLAAPRRTLLDSLLVEAARAAGADVRHEMRADQLLLDGDGRVRGAVLRGADGRALAVRADLVIGADGRRSQLARLTGAAVEHQAKHAAAVIYGYFEGWPADGFHWYYTPGRSAGVIPTNDGRVNVFVSLPRQRFRAARSRGFAALHRQVLGEISPDLAQQAAAAHRVGEMAAFPGQPGFLRRSHGLGWALVGDAGAFRDPITAHGITDALRDAELLAGAVIDGSEAALGRYQQQRDALARGLLETTDRVASLDWTLEEVKALHLDLSRQMNAELEALQGFGSQPLTAPRAAEWTSPREARAV